MTLRKRSYIFESMKRDNQGRDLGAVKRRFDRDAEVSKAGRRRSNAVYARYEKSGWSHPEWAKVEGILVMRVGKEPVVAVPVSGRKNARFFEMIDLDKRELLTRLKKDEVVPWMFAAWKQRHGF